MEKTQKTYLADFIVEQDIQAKDGYSYTVNQIDAYPRYRDDFGIKERKIQ